MYLEGQLDMTGMIVNRLAEIKDAKAKQDGSPITWEKVAADTGLAYSTVLRWGKGQIDRYDDKALAKFCEYFRVGVGDILVYEE